MKRELFNVADEEFMTLLERTDKAFREEGISHMFVGGVATQCYMAKYLCDIYGGSLLDLASSEKVRMQDRLRSTDDVDIALSMGNIDDIEAGKKIYSVLERIVGEGEFLSPSDEHIISIDLLRKGHVKPQFQVGIDKDIDPDRIVAFNLYRKPKDLKDKNLEEFEDKFYDFFIGRAVDLSIPYCDGKTINLKVKNPADLLATKIVRGREKDIADALSLIRYSRKSNDAINYADVRKVLCGNSTKYGIPNEVLSTRYDVLMSMVESLNTDEPAHK